MRYGKVIEAQVYREVKGPISFQTLEMHVDSKKFNNGLFKREPTDEDYQKASCWADEVIAMHRRNTE